MCSPVALSRKSLLAEQVDACSYSIAARGRYPGNVQIVNLVSRAAITGL
jgi:hypothetical protein